MIVPLFAVDGTADINQEVFVSVNVPLWIAAEITELAVRAGETFEIDADE